MEIICYEKKEHIATITINRPEVLNAFNQQTLTELIEALEIVENDQDVYCAVLTAAGDKAFTAGGDIKQEITLKGDAAREFSRLGKKCLSKIYDLRVPLISAVQGYALGGGMEIILVSDITVAADTAKIGIPTIKLGTVPGWGSTQMLSRVVGISRAKELLYTGRTVKAQEALEIGLVEFVVEPDQLMTKAYEIAHRIADMAPIAMESMKIAINTSVEDDLEHGFDVETELFVRCYGTEDKQEAMSAFLEKREHQTYQGK